MTRIAILSLLVLAACGANGVPVRPTATEGTAPASLEVGMIGDEGVALTK